jgi:hypothetical protein
VAGRSKLLHNYLFQALLAERRPVRCNDLDEQATKLARRERRQSAGELDNRPESFLVSC